MVISDIWSILLWYQFLCTKIYLIYGQISDIWSEIQIKTKAKASHCVAKPGYFHSRIASGGSGNPMIGFLRASTHIISYQPFQPISMPFQPLSTLFHSNIWYMVILLIWSIFCRSHHGPYIRYLLYIWKGSCEKNWILLTENQQILTDIFIHLPHLSKRLPCHLDTSLASRILCPGLIRNQWRGGEGRGGNSVLIKFSRVQDLETSGLPRWHRSWTQNLELLNKGSKMTIIWAKSIKIWLIYDKKFIICQIDSNLDSFTPLQKRKQVRFELPARIPAPCELPGVRLSENVKIKIIYRGTLSSDSWKTSYFQRIS